MMRKSNKNSFLLFVLLACSASMMINQLAAQTFTTLYSLVGGTNGTTPGSLVVSGNKLYGVADGGASGGGMIFSLNTDGTGFTNLHNLTASTDGSAPLALVVSDGT